MSAPGVVTGRYGTLGEVFFIERDFWPLNTALYVRDFKGNDPKFVYYLLKSLDFSSFNDKSSVPGLNRNHLHEMPVIIPADVSEQRAIAHILGKLDDKIELNRRMNQTLQELANALFTSWFVTFDPICAMAEGRQPKGMDMESVALFPRTVQATKNGPLPAGWHAASILSHARLLSGGTPRTQEPAYWNGDVPWASAKDISQSAEFFLLDTERSITQRGLHESSTQLIPALATVVIARGATTGRMALLGREMAMNQTCYALVSSTETPFTLFLRIQWAIGQMVQAAHGSVFDTITTSTFAYSTVVLPPPEVLQAFERMIDPMFKRMLANSMESRTLAELRDTLSRRLLSGELSLKGLGRVVEEC